MAKQANASSLQTDEILRGMEEHIAEIRSGKNGKYVAGNAQEFSPAASCNDRWSKKPKTGPDTIAQGDLLIAIFREIPEGFKSGDELVINKKDIPKDFTEITPLMPTHMQLVPGNTEGAKHCLAHLEGVRMFRPANWNEESLEGPILAFSKANAIVHPVHGNVTIPAGFICDINYDRQWDVEQRKEARARD